MRASRAINLQRLRPLHRFYRGFDEQEHTTRASQYREKYNTITAVLSAREEEDVRIFEEAAEDLLFYNEEDLLEEDEEGVGC